MKKLLVFLACLLAIPAGAQNITGSGGGGAGSVTSIATGCSATGGTITAIGTISTQETITPLTGANAAITTGYCGGVEYLSNAAAQTPTIAEAGTTGFPAGWFTDLCNTGFGIQSLTPAAGTIGGAAVYALPGGAAAYPTCVRIISDGVSNYTIIGQSPLPPQTTMYVNAANTWYSPYNQANSNTAAPAGVAGTVYFAPFWISQPITIEGLAIYIHTAGAGSVAWCLGLYSNTGNRPTSSTGLLAYACSTSTGTATQTLALTNGNSVAGISTWNAGPSTISILRPGWYWLAYQAGDTTQTINYCYTYSNYNGVVGDTTAANVLAVGGTNPAIVSTGSPGTLPTTFSFSINTSNHSPCLAYEIASVP